MSKEPLNRGGPPEDPEHWEYFHNGIEKAHKSWVVAGPIYAAVTNWKAWVAIVAFIVALNQPEISGLVQRIMEAAQ